MKTLLIAPALLFAACAAPRAEREASAPDEPDEETPAAHATCTRQDPCPLDVVQIARRRAELEADTAAKMTHANDNPHMKQVADNWMRTLARSIADERERFSRWCELAQGWSAAKRRSGVPGLTPEDLVKWTGPPGQEVKPESRDGSVESTAWTWEVSGPLSQSVSFAILFMRPAGTDVPFVFGGCQWCASGGPATSHGCMTLPAGKP